MLVTQKDTHMIDTPDLHPDVWRPNLKLWLAVVGQEPHKITQTDLADAAGVARQNLSDHLRGVNVPLASTLVKYGKGCHTITTRLNRKHRKKITKSRKRA